MMKPGERGMVILQATESGKRELTNIPKTWTASDKLCSYYAFRGTGTPFTRPGFAFIDNLPDGCQWEIPTDAAEVAELPKELLEAVTEDIDIEKPKGKAILDGGVFRPIREPPKLEAITAADLANKAIPEIRWIVKGVLPEGLAILAAPPKFYKSFLSLDLCLSVVSGRKFLGFETVKSGALYFDLESNERRPQTRMNLILRGERPEGWENLFFITAAADVRKLGDGFVEQLSDFLDVHENVKLIVIDVFQLIKPPAKRGQNAYEADYAALRELSQMAKTRGITILLVHHTKKARDTGDPFNDMSGSTAMSGAMDSIWMISKKDRFSDEATLSVSGRDIESRKMAVHWDKELFRWICDGDREEIENREREFKFVNEPVVIAVKSLVKNNGGHWEGSAQEIVAASRYTGKQIFDSPEKVARIIDEYQGLFLLDGMTYERKRKGNKRVFIFNCHN